jgi:ssRNA-specific RNase YbeY (16S rRNA maturation enzyme)
VAQDHGTRIDRVNYVLMTISASLAYNETFLHHDDLTDVITFPVESNNGVVGTSSSATTGSRRTPPPSARERPT